jgi:acetoin utilization protein AcuB
MLVKNWMLPQQYSISSEALAVEAVALMEDHNLKMLPVVDDGRLRGIVHRRDLSDAASCVSRSGDLCEMNYFCKKLKVKDLMVRRPATVSIEDSVEDTLIKGRALTMSTFPVLDGENVVGVVSDREIFVTLFRLLEAAQDRTRITLTDVTLEPGTLSEILKIVDDARGLARAVFTVPENKDNKVRVVLRLTVANPDALKKALEARGYRILEYSKPKTNGQTMG